MFGSIQDKTLQSNNVAWQPIIDYCDSRPLALQTEVVGSDETSEVKAEDVYIISNVAYPCHQCLSWRRLCLMLAPSVSPLETVDVAEFSDCNLEIWPNRIEQWKWRDV